MGGKPAFMVKRVLRNRVFSAYSTSLLSVFSGLITSFWLLKLIVNVLPDNYFGAYSLLLQIASYISVLQLGLDFTVSRFIAEAIAKQEFQKANENYWNLIRFNRYVVLVAFLVVVGTAMGISFGYLFHLFSAEDRTFALVVFLLIGTNQLVGFLQRPIAAALIGSNQQHLVNLTAVCKSLAISLIGGALLLYTSWGIYGVLIAEILLSTINWWLLRQIKHYKCPWIVKRPVKSEVANFMVQLKFAAVTTLGGIAWTIEATSDSIILGLTGDLSLVGIYMIWWRFPQMAFDFVSRLATSAFPAFTTILAQGGESAKLTLAKYTYISTGLATLAFIGISLWLPSFIHLWMDGKFDYPNAKILASLIGFVVYLRISGNLLGMFILAANYPKITTRSAWIQAIVKVMVAGGLVHYLGIIGVVIASLIASVLQVVLLSMFLVRRNWLSLFTALHSSIIAVAFLILSFFLPESTSFSSIGQFGIGILCTSLGVVLLWCIILIHSPLRGQLTSLLTKIKTVV